MTWEIRPATQDERDRFVRSTWRRSFTQPRSRATALGRGEYFNLRDGARVDKTHWLAMHEWLIAETLDGESAHVYVAAIGSECIGWVCWHGEQLHYVYVAPRFRRRGVGVSLMFHCLPAFQRGTRTFAPSHMTHEGELLLAAVLRQQARSHTQQPAEARAHDG